LAFWANAATPDSETDREGEPDPPPGGDRGNALAPQHAKLMEDNPLLRRLKELESLERLVEKVGRIDLHAGKGAGMSRSQAFLKRAYISASGSSRCRAATLTIASPPVTTSRRGADWAAARVHTQAFGSSCDKTM
jgi:hypothetical protein